MKNPCIGCKKECDNFCKLKKEYNHYLKNHKNIREYRELERIESGLEQVIKNGTRRRGKSKI